MNETKFTPGPWIARIEDHSFCDTGDVFTSFTVATEGAGKYDCFAEVFTRNDDIYEAAANTRLIAAAPEMYEFGETTAEVLQILLERLGPNPAGLNAEIKRLAEERIAEWQKIEKKARGEE